MPAYEEAPVELGVTAARIFKVKIKRCQGLRLPCVRDMSYQHTVFGPDFGNFSEIRSLFMLNILNFADKEVKYANDKF